MRTLSEGRFSAWLPWVVLAVALSAAVWAYQTAEEYLSLKARNSFDGRVEQIKTAINDRIQVYEQVLQGARGLFAASNAVTRSEWKRYLDAVDISKNYPGLNGVGFVTRVPAPALNRFLSATRADGAPDFSIKPEGLRDEYFVVTFMEPSTEHIRRLGFDIGADVHSRRPAAEVARDKNRATISGRFTYADDQAGFAFLLPVYRNGAPLGSVEDRRAALLGWIYCPFDVGHLMKGILGAGVQDIGFEIYDGIGITPENLLYATHPRSHLPAAPDPPTFGYSIPIEVGERVWMLNFATRPEFDAATDRGGPILVLIAGFLGSLLMFSVTSSLVMTRRRALAEAESMTAKLRSVLTEASEAFVAMDESGLITDWNRQAEVIFGWRRAEAKGRRMSDLIIPPKYRESHIRGLQHFIQTGEGPFMNRRIELSALRRDGTEFPVEITIWAIRTAETYTFNAFIHDITDRKRAQKELLLARYAAEGANRAKSEFLANMSHELRAPLNSVIGFAEVLQKNGQGALGDQEMAYLDRILENGNHLLGLINQVLDLSKVEARQMAVNIEPIYLDIFVQETLDQMEARVLGRNLSLTADLPRPMAPLSTDATKLKQVLINLISNAIKFTDRGAVTVRVAVDEESRRPLRIDVIDTGIGIPPDQIERIFAPFQQVDSGASRPYGGTGLGLTISRSLCQLMGYRLEVESQVGRGSTFSVILPADRPDAGDSESEPLDQSFRQLADDTDEFRGPSREEFSGRTVLVIDDEPDSRLLLTHHFESFRLQVRSAGSAEQGIRMARERTPDLITMDLMMRGSNGWQAVESLKSDPQLRHIPVVVISNVAAETRGTFPPGVDLLNKPVNPDELVRVLRKHLPADAKP